MKRHTWCAWVLSAMLLSGCGAQRDPLTQSEPAVPAAEMMQLDVQGKDADAVFSVSQYRFALELMRAVQREKGQQNVMVSPYSVVQALAMTANGAANQTRTEMEKVLGNGISINDLNQYLYTWRMNQPADDSCQLHTANGIWINETIPQIKPLFAEQTRNFYAAGMKRAAFDKQTLREINQFVKKETDDMIPKILEELDPAAVTVLVNAVGFDAKWLEPYPSDKIKDGKFNNADGSESAVQMMKSTESDYLKSEGAVGFLRYYDGPYAFAGILPPEDVTLQEWLDAQTPESLIAMIAGREECAVSATMPAFSGGTEVQLETILPGMGMPTAFSAEADFSCLADGGMQISEVIHKTHIDVDAQGTKAAAATAVVMTRGADKVPKEEKTVRLDRPFVYMILDMHNELPVFIGSVNQL